MTDWILGFLTGLAVIGGGFAFAYLANPFRSEIDEKKKLLRACSWNGDGRGVHCGVCGDHLTVSNIGGTDEDGNGYCYLHTRKKK